MIRALRASLSLIFLLDLTSFLTQGSFKCYDFLSDKNTRSIFCSNEATLGGFLGDSWVGTGHQKDQVIIRSLEFSTPILIFQRGKKEVKMEVITDQGCMKKPLQNSHSGAFRASRLVEHISTKGYTLTPGRQKLLHSRPSQTSSYVSLLCLEPRFLIAFIPVVCSCFFTIVSSRLDREGPYFPYLPSSGTCPNASE